MPTLPTSPPVSLIPAYSAPFKLPLKEPFLHTGAAAACTPLSVSALHFCAGNVRQRGATLEIETLA